jgi:excisionase family DNA binding protein
MTPDLRTWLTPKAAAAALGVSEQTVMRRIDAKQLTAVNVSAGTHRRRYRIDPRSIINPC